MVITSISHAFVCVGRRDRGRGLRGLAPHLPCPALLSKDERIRLQREGPPRSASVTLATAEPPPRAAAHTDMASSAVEPRPITPPTHPLSSTFPRRPSRISRAHTARHSAGFGARCCGRNEHKVGVAPMVYPSEPPPPFPFPCARVLHIHYVLRTQPLRAVFLRRRRVGTAASAQGGVGACGPETGRAIRK